MKQKEEVKGFEENLAHPYFKAIATWLETIRIGMYAEELYEKIEDIFPKKNIIGRSILVIMLQMKNGWLHLFL